MRSLLNTLRRLPEFEDLLLRIDAGRCPVAASGLSPVHRAFVAAGIALRAERPVVLLCADEVDAARLSKDVSALLEQPVMQLPAREFTFHTAATASHQWEQRRLAVLKAMADGAAPVVAATVEPDFSSKELCDGCGVLDPLLVPGKLLLSGEYARLVKEITKLSGFTEQEDEVKN